MPPRDLTYVITAMMRPLQMSDPYNEDHYFHNFRESETMKIAAQLSLPMPPQLQHMTPLPAMYKQKQAIAKKEAKFRDNVEKRASKWEEETKSLGHTVKSNTARPRALLAVAAVLSQQHDETLSEEDGKRADLWSARTLIDQGFAALLTLMELQRVVQDGRVDERKKEIVKQKDVRRNIHRLETCFGIIKDRKEVAVQNAQEAEEEAAGVGDDEQADAGADPAAEPSATPKKRIFYEYTVVGCDAAKARAMLSLPKGMQLLARCVETGILPHHSATLILPIALAFILKSPRPANSVAGAVEKEDRLLSALSKGLIEIESPSISPEVAKKCLSDVFAEHEDKNELKASLADRTRLAALHACISRGTALCEGDAEWSALEEKLVEMLAQQ
jgi:hypothetical protein